MAEMHKWVPGRRSHGEDEACVLDLFVFLRYPRISFDSFLTTLAGFSNYSIWEGFSHSILFSSVDDRLVS